jgi:hypothetical protein
MCGRYEAGQKQKIAEAFHVSVDLEEEGLFRRSSVELQSSCGGM